MTKARDLTNVIPMNQYRQNTNHPALAQVEGYWEGLRNGRIMPTRAEVDPRGIAGALEYAFVLERVARGIARFRLAGMHLTDLMGMEVRGMPLTALMSVAGRPAVTEALEAVFDTPAVVRLELAADTGIGRPPLSAQMILLPLRSDLGDVTRALGCLVANGPIVRAPRRFAVADEHRRTLIGYGTAPAVRPTGQPHEPAGFAELTAGLTGSAGRTSHDRSYLKLIKND